MKTINKKNSPLAILFILSVLILVLPQSSAGIWINELSTPSLLKNDHRERMSSPRDRIVGDHPPIIEWEKTFDKASTREEGFAVQQTTDGGYIILGSVYLEHHEMWLIKTDELGTIEWEKLMGINAYGQDIIQTTDEGYMLTGISFLSGDALLIKTDSNGTIEWTTEIPEEHESISHSAYSVIQTQDNGFVITGYGLGLYLAKVDCNGTLEWDHNLNRNGISDVASGQDVKQTLDGGYIIAGMIRQYKSTTNDYNVWLIKTDEHGEEEWNRTYGKLGANKNHDKGYSLDITTDRGYIITGYTSSYSDQYHDLWLIKTNASGNIEWKKNHSYPDKLSAGYAIQQTHDNGFIIAGETHECMNGDVWIVKTNTTGSKTWELIFEAGGNGIGHDIQQTNDNGYIIVGTYGCGGSEDIYLIKLSSEDYENQPPKAPTIYGTSQGKPGETQNFTIGSTDPEHQNIWYYIDWGDNSFEEWFGPFQSNESLKVYHTWEEQGTYIIRVKAKDSYDAESNWSTLEITMPKPSINVIDKMILQIFNRFILPTTTNLKIFFTM